MIVLAPRGAGAEEPSAVNTIEFLTRVQGSTGVVRCGLFQRAGWLTQPVQAAISAIRGDAALCVFTRVRAGVFAISAFHDANNNGKLDTNFLGMPLEDYCASRNAHGVLGPPSFDDAKFDYRGTTLRLEANMR
ncbi:MAG TPA: DUF2141 domain-containing protein [Polyangiaceae bacterium]